MRWFLVLLTLLFIWACQSAPQIEEAALAKRAEKLVSMALDQGQSYALLTDLCTTAPHRLSGSAGADVAVQWGKGIMQRLGMSNIKLEKVMVPHWRRGEVEELRLGVCPTGSQLSVSQVAAG